MASLSIENVKKSFGSTPILHDVSIQIPDGAFVILVGPSGCGKSTLLRMIAGLEEISAGVIRIGSRVVNGVAPKERDIAMVFQSYALYPHMTVQENMAFSLKLKSAPKAEVQSKVARAAGILGLQDLLARYPKELSGGQRQRVAMGRAIVRDPSVFLFDEPLSNLDAKLRVQMRGEIKSLHQRLETTTVYVTHDQIEAMTMADQIVVMNHGRIEQIGAPLELYDRPANLFVAGFIGSPSMNFITGTVGAEGFKTADGLTYRSTPMRRRTPELRRYMESAPSISPWTPPACPSPSKSSSPPVRKPRCRAGSAINPSRECSASASTPSRARRSAFCRSRGRSTCSTRNRAGESIDATPFPFEGDVIAKRLPSFYVITTPASSDHP